MSGARIPAWAAVIAARDMDRFIDATLDSVASQTATDFEAIVVDDGSRDGTRAIVERRSAVDARFRAIDGPCSGVGAARNRGLAEARAPVTLFLDADDLLVPEAVERLLRALAERPGAPAALGHHRRIAEDGAPLDPPLAGFTFPAEGTLEALIAKNFVVNGGALAIRTDAARACGGYPEGLAYGEDWEFWCRLALHGDFATEEGPSLLLYRQRGAGANYRARTSLLARDVPCLDRIATNEAIRSRIGSKLPRLLRQRRIDIFWAGVRSELQFGSTARAFATAAAGLALYPDSLLRPQLALRFLRSLAPR